MMSFLFWDPDRVAFLLPLIHHPITWYGIFFAIGFLVGFYLLRAFFARFLAYYPLFTSSDILNWHALVEKMDTPLEKFMSTPSFKTLTQKKGEFSEKEKTILLNALNDALDHKELFPFSPEFSSFEKRILAFAKKRLEDKAYQRILHRLCFEAIFPKALKSMRARACIFTERLTLYIVVGTVLGARLGHILFYEKWGEYWMDLLRILKVWEGGLASHGAVLGIIIALFFFCFRSRRDYPMISFPRAIDLLVVPALFVSTLVRMGNFINQEILGKSTTLPWAIVFGHPADGSFPCPCHPVQIYEALFYFCLFFLFSQRFFSWLFPKGRLGGLFFILVFVFRFVIEFFKREQSVFLPSSFFTMGQYLSIPMVGVGILLLWGRKLFRIRNFSRKELGEEDG